MIGRADELRLLAAAVAPGRTDGLAVAVVAGGGLGMTALLTATAREAAQRGYRVLHATGRPDERELPGLVLQQLLQPLRPVVVELPPDEQPAATAAVTLSTDDAATLAAGAEALLSALARRSPVAVVTDDLHFADELSRQVLTRLLTDLRCDPVVFLLGVRPDHAARLGPVPSRLGLAPLLPADAGTLLASQPGLPRGRGRLDLHRRAAGRPRALLDLAAAFAGASDEDIRRLAPARTLPMRHRYASRFAALPAATRELVQLAAARAGDEDLTVLLRAAASGAATAEDPVSGRDVAEGDGVTGGDPVTRGGAALLEPAVEMGLAEGDGVTGGDAVTSGGAALLEPAVDMGLAEGDGVAGGDPVTRGGAALLEPAVDMGLLEVEGSTVRFGDPLAEIAAYLSVPAADRALLHERLAAALVSGSAAATMQDACAATGPSEEIAAALQRSCAGGAAFERARALQWAAELTPDPVAAARRHAGAMAGAEAAGQASWVLDLYAEVRRLDPDTARIPGVVRTATAAMVRTGRIREAMDLLLDCVRHRPPANRLDGLTVAATAAFVARVSGLAQHRAVVAELLARADTLPLDRPAEPSELSRADLPMLRASAAAVLGSHVMHLQVPRLAAGLTAGAVPRALLFAQVADAGGDTRTALELRLRALEVLRDSGGVAGVPELWLPLLTNLIDTGRWAEADALVAEGRRVCAGADLPLLELELAAVAASLAGVRGDGPRARELAEGVRSAADLHQNGRLHVVLHQALGLAAFAEGDFESAYRHHRRLFTADGAPLDPDRSGVLLLGTALCAPRAGQTADAIRLLEAAGPPDTVRKRLIADQVRALLVDDDESETLFRRVIDEPLADTWPLDKAVAQLHYGSRLRRRRRVAEAREQLAAGLAGFEAAGATRLAEFARAELSAAGTPPVPGPRRATDSPSAAGPPPAAGSPSAAGSPTVDSRFAAGSPPAADSPPVGSRFAAGTPSAAGPRGAAGTSAAPESEGSSSADGGVLSTLTPQQRQIVRLAARGLRNHEIAAELLLSPRTVGTHLYHAYPKLGVRSRRELSALFD
ncbi:helix-turn-helix transcriptional regulator [Actinoplanes sp. RD1]|uniref:helix-turn-helix transcriptional regulator n=1 Tax=Actinoplanes sp. RD1 TaxID=3064538 RepID=UPI00274282C0|nr:LuxR family transcriptional regulator [Actinoplanes sp. RD1]